MREAKRMAPRGSASKRASGSKLARMELRPASLVDEISRILTEAILEGVFRGGEQLVEAELKEQFRVSRTPIREALRALEKKGLVEIVPRKGAFVRTITGRDIQEHFPVRAVLEGLAAKEALCKVGAREIQEMESALEGMNNAVKAQEAKSYWEHHRQFHETFIRASGNGLLIGLLNTLRTHALWYRFSYQYYQEDLEGSLSMHRDILHLFRQKDPNRGKELEELVRVHIEAALERFLSYLEAQEKGDGELATLPEGRA